MAYINSKGRIAWFLGAIISMASAAGNAGVILSAVSGTINSGGPGFGSLTDTLDQSGLETGYTSGVTDFDTYLGTDPLHSIVFAGFEWFANTGITGASVTYDLGAATVIDALALWNEESAGIMTLDVLASLDGVSFASIASGLMPTDNVLADGSYGADVFQFAALSTQFVRLDFTGGPDESGGGFTGGSIAEIAFRQGVIEPPSDVPAPATIALIGLGLAGLGWKRRRKA